MEIKQSGSGITSLVPQFFFDVIARLLPGILLIGIFLLVGMGVQHYWDFFHHFFKPQELQIPSVSLLLGLGLVLGYTLSIVLWGVWYSLNRLNCALNGNRDPETGIELSEEELRRRISKIKLERPDAGARLTKIKAEIHMAATLFVGFSLASIVNAVLIYHENEVPSRIITGLLLILAMIGALGGRTHFTKHMESALKAEWESIKQD